MQDQTLPPGLTGIEIAIVGMAGRFPGAPDIDAFWRNIRDGVESVTVFSDEQLRARGVPERTLADPDYVKAGVLFEGFDQFDAGFFGYSPREAEHLDPQQRIFLECAWEALEHAGWKGGKGNASVGVYAGDGPNLYLMRHLLPAFGVDASTGIADLLGLMSGNSAGSLCTRVAYKLDLRGPAVSVQTECSTSLVAVHMACQALLSHDCDMALAGGVWLNLLQEGGYRYQSGAILSPDGHCRAFDAKAAGTVIGSGAGIVALKRLEEALRDGDTIHAVIKGSAANNDGSDKIGFTAPSVQGQASAIRAALMVADVPASTIGYVEAHGTGTTLGDPIEMAALMQAFASGELTAKGQCAIGSVKTNIGHLDAAAGVAGLIKAAMALRHRTLPPSLHFEQPNPQIDFENSPFYVNTEARPWPKGGAPRRAGVSSFGIGGTNVHVVLEEAPAVVAQTETSGWQVLPLSAMSATALRQATQRLAAHIEEHPGVALADVSHTLQTGRRAFTHRCAVVANESATAARMLASGEDLITASAPVPEQPAEVAFLFPGGGTQHANMGLALYRGDVKFREDIDHCCELLRPELGLDLRELLFPAPGAEVDADAKLFDIALAQPALFVIEYAMAYWWMRRGVQPTVMMGHSLGEYVAACLSGVFRLEDALRVAALRGRLLQSMPPGAMTAVPLSQAELAPFLTDGCDLGAANGEQLCVISGPLEAIEAAEQKLRVQGHLPRRLHVSIASHSAMTQPLLAELEQLIASVPRQAPKIPFISNVTGRLITAAQAVSPNYWAQHLRGTVHFTAGLRTLFEVPGRVVLEVGPGETLAGLARQHPMAGSAAGVYASQAHPQQQTRNAQQIVHALASLWLAGVDIDWTACHAGLARRRVPLPAYPFQRRRYWVDMPDAASAKSAHKPPSDAFYVPSWKRIEPLVPTVGKTTDAGCVLVLGDSRSFTCHLVQHLQSQGHAVVVAERGQTFARTDREGWMLRPGEHDDHAQLLREVEADFGAITAIYHLWCLDEVPAWQPQPELLERSFFSLLALVQALDTGGGNARKLPLAIIANQIEDVTGAETLCPEKATLLGIGKVIGQECSRVHCRVIDVMLPAPDSEAETLLVEQIAAESVVLQAEPGEPLLAYRGAHRWAKTYEPAPLPATAQRLRQQGVYLITGGLGGVGLAIAKHLAQHWKARLVLLGRTAMPKHTAWASITTAADQSDALKNKLLRLLEIEALGAEVLTVVADVSDPAQLHAALELVHVRFGALHGIVHAAGDAGGGMMAKRTRAQVDTVFATKVRGTRTLLDAVRGQPLDFVQFCSSISSVAGGLGMSDYAAANAYLDATAIAHARIASYPIFSVNWDAWRGLGMAENMEVPDGIGMHGPEGARTFERIVNGPLRPQTVISTTDLAQRLGPLDDDMLDMLDAGNAQPVTGGSSHPRPALQTPFIAPEGELANALAALWTERLGIAPIGVNDNLFELGGDSLVAIQLLSRVRKAYAVELHPSEFFKAPTIAGLMTHMPTSGAPPEPQQAAAMEISPVARTGVLPLSPMQRRLWLVDRLTDAGNITGRAAYNMSAGLALHGELNVDVLRAAIDAIVARHEVLRTLFAEDDEGEPVAVIRPCVHLDVPLIEIDEASTTTRERRYATLFDELVRMPFALAEGPLIKATIVRLGEHEHVLVLVVHHIVFDGWSIAVFARELGEFYERALRGQLLQLTPLPVQYVDYAAWYDRALASETFAPKAGFWRTYLRNAPQVSTLKPDHQRPAMASHAGNSVQLVLSPILSQALATLARESDTSLFTLLLSSFFLFFHQASGADDIVIGTDVAGRGHPDLEQLLGFFVNVVPVRSRMVDRQAGFSQWLAQTKQQTLAAMDHQDVPFDQIVELSGAQRARDRNPLVQVLFVLQNTPEIRFSIEGAEVEVLPQQMNESKFDLAVFAREQAGVLTVEWVYATDLYQRETVEKFTASWHALLERIVAIPGQAVDALAPTKTQERITMNTAKSTGAKSKLDKLGKIGKAGLGGVPPRAAVRPAVQTSFLKPGADFPIVLQATTDDLDTVAWARSQADYIEMLVAKHGGILFRNFGLRTPQDFEAFAEAIEPELYGSYGDLPKKEGGKKTYRSTPYPEQQMILFHNESSHLDRWPRKQWFFCEMPSPVGGATPIVDCREMLRRLPVDMVAEFERKELLYVRTFTPGLDVSWQDFYKTNRREDVEARLVAAGITWRWLDNDTLQTRTRCPAVIRHPLTGEKVFFNQIQLHHVACLEGQVREDLLAMGGIDRLPRHVMYGDGSPISDETMAFVGRVYEECAVRFNWQQGDIVMLDNMLAAHARDPYEGPRKIVVAMGAMFDRTALEDVPKVAADTRLADELGA
ncbi:Acyl transferase domain-containing protein [Rhodoferax sp. OV413]|uniref:type I polyketide synthase n=1 Tax=Rhodoferax sp. OV413 TaxID=1855285 RepID=UPI00088957C2|nr:type I polyketide synthase [Rhodoferax sp. OV413]SDO97651.1 Acyl transferase domain-containing protein [Rhodoferax sp. OV413]